MRWAWVVMLLLTGCEEDSECGIDADGDIIPVCFYTEAPDNPAYCPGDGWQSADGCATCGCGPEGQIICTDNLRCETTPE